MRSTSLTLLGLISSAHSTRFPRRVDQSINPRAEYIGGWAWSTSDTCSGSWSTTCGTSNNSCCPAGETCFKTGYGAYCCPTGEDCINKLLTLPACADQSMDMYPWPSDPRYFCCLPGLVAIVPYSGDGGLCLPADQKVPASEILTASAQVGVGISRSQPPIASATKAPSTSGTITDSVSYTSGTYTSSTLPSATNPSTQHKNSSEENNSIGTGGIVGIAIGISIIVITIYIIRRFRRRQKLRRAMNIASPLTPLPPMPTLPAPKPMYVSTGQPYYVPRPYNGGDERSSAVVTTVEQTQSAVPASTVPLSEQPVSPLSDRAMSPPPPPYAASPSAQYVELHGQASLPSELHGQASLPGELPGATVDGWRPQGGRGRPGESTTGRHEM